MKLPKDCKVEKVSAKHDKYRSRPVLEAPWYQDGNVYATDSHKLVRIPVEHDDSDIAGTVPVDAIKASRRNGEYVGLTSPTESHTTAGKFPRDCTLDLPNAEQLFPDWEGSEGPNTVVTVTLNAKQLFEVADALGASNAGVTLRWNNAESGKPILVFPIGGPEGRTGLLMPIRTAAAHSGAPA